VVYITKGINLYTNHSNSVLLVVQFLITLKLKRIQHCCIQILLQTPEKQDVLIIISFPLTADGWVDKFALIRVSLPPTSLV